MQAMCGQIGGCRLQRCGSMHPLQWARGGAVWGQRAQTHTPSCSPPRPIPPATAPAAALQAAPRVNKAMLSASIGKPVVLVGRVNSISGPLLIVSAADGGAVTVHLPASMEPIMT